jgi:tetratricopeptide (TPR) repeat protein
MGKYYVPFVARTPADRVREALDGAEDRVISFRGRGPQALELLHLMDQAARGLAELEEAGVDVRAELTRFETIQRQLQRRKRQFLSAAGAAFREERDRVQPDRDRWWWYVEELVAEERAQRLRQIATWGAVGIVVLAVLWVLYDRFVRPPANVREAYQRSGNGQFLVEPGEDQDFDAALVEFRAAAESDPIDPEYWVWIGVVQMQLGDETGAQESFDRADSLYADGLQLLIQRAQAYSRVGDLDRASADADNAVTTYPEEGWAYAVRANVAVARADYTAAIADLEAAADLGAQAGDTQLEAFARTQRGMVIQMQASQLPTPEATPEP